MENSQETFFPDNLIAGRYEALGFIGKGGTSLVFRAYDEGTDKIVALKTLINPHCPMQRPAFVGEAQRLQQINHDGVIKIHDFFTDEDDRDWMVMDYIAGTDLRKLIEDTGSRAMAIDKFQEVAAQTLSALEAVHNAGILHLDLKPENIVINVVPMSGALKATLIDFGSSSASCNARTTGEPDRFGSIYFAAPESFTKRGPDNRADIYSLGCVFYYMLTGKYPFQGDSDVEVMASHLMGRFEPIGAIRAELPWNILTIVTQMIALDRDSRPGSMMEIWHQLSAEPEKELKSGNVAIKGGTGFLPVPRLGRLPDRRDPRKLRPIGSGATADLRRHGLFKTQNFQFS